MTPETFKKNTLTFLSLIFISASEFLVFPLLFSEGNSSNEAAIFAILIIGFFISGMYMLFNTQIITQKNNLDIVPVKQNKIFAVILSLGILTNLAVAGFTFYILSKNLYGGILFVKEVSKPQVHDPNIPKQAQKVDYEKENDPNFGQNPYVYWVHVKGQYENGCCIFYPNPSRPIADGSYYFELKQETQPDPRGYEGVVCSPDCDGKVIWSGPVTFSEGKVEWNKSLVAGQPDVVTVKAYNLVLTPTGQLNGSFDELQKKLVHPSGFYEVIVKDKGCKDDSCIVKRKIFVGRAEGGMNVINVNLTASDNIKFGASYDVYLCDTGCSKNHPREDWNPRVCKATAGNLWLTFNPDYYVGQRPDRCN